MIGELNDHQLENSVLHGKSKNIDVRYHFPRDLTNDNVIELVHYRSEDHVVDIITKPLKTIVFIKLRGLLGVCSKKNAGLEEKEMGCQSMFYKLMFQNIHFMGEIIKYFVYYE